MKKEDLRGKLFWELPEIDLNLRHYSGEPSDVLKNIQSQIEQYLSQPIMQENYTTSISTKKFPSLIVTYNIREIYSAVYNAINYYKSSFYLPSPKYNTSETFLSNSLKIFNNDYSYLSKQYNPSTPFEEPVIDMVGRIKSPISFMDKVREKVSEYISKNRDFCYFNESLRDLIGIRIIVTPPKDISSQGLQAESDYLYKIYLDLMKEHGILQNIQNNENPQNVFKFLKVNTRNSPDKLTTIKERITFGFAPDVDIFVPQTRPDIFNNDIIDSVLKDYNLYPKFKGYQSLHTCVCPPFSKSQQQIEELPTCIIPPKYTDCSFEYQFRTKRQDDCAKYGSAAEHKEPEPYHRLRIPFYIGFNQNNPSSNNKELIVKNFGDSFENFTGTSFESYFGVPFSIFRDKFTSNDRTAILAGEKIVKHNPVTNTYTSETIEISPILLAITPADFLNLQNTITYGTPSELATLLSELNLTYNNISVPNNPLESTTSSTPNFRLCPLITSEESLHVKDPIKAKLPQFIIKQNNTNVTEKNDSKVISLDD